MRVTIGSAFRNSARNQHLGRYEAQLFQLRDLLRVHGHSLDVVFVEGDSVDTTARNLADILRRFGPGRLEDVSHGGPVYGSTESPVRMQALCGVGNGILANVPKETDVLVYVESDLIWDPVTIWGLMQRLSSDVDVVAPLIFAGKHFYDVFAFRGLDGERFSPFVPWHSSFTNAVSPLIEVGSAGSCLVMKGEVARTCRIPPEDALVGFCRNAKSAGYRIWVDSAGTVRHPA